MILRLLTFGFFALSSICPAQAATPACTRWPSILGASGPEGGLAGFPFTFNIRFSCVPGTIFSVEAIEGEYRTDSGAKFPAPIALSTFPLPDGNTLFQFNYDVPADQPTGIYKLAGCVRLRRGGGATVCLPISQIMEIAR